VADGYTPPFDFNLDREDIFADESFVVPGTFNRLPDVTITRPASPGVQSLPAASRSSGFLTRVVGGVARVISNVARPIMLFLVPGNMGEEGTGNLFGGPGALYQPGDALPPANAYAPPVPEETEPEYLPDVVVTPPPPKPPNTTVVGDDPIMPPNWEELSDPGDKVFESAPGRRPTADPTRLPIPDFGDQPAPEPLSDPRELPAPVGPLVFPDQYAVPDVEVMPTLSPYAPPVFPTAFGYPDVDVERPASPGPSQLPRPGTSTRPSTRPPSPAPGIPAFPVEFPFLPFSPPENYRPTTPQPGGTSLPDFFSDPVPDIFAEPEFDSDRPTSDDQCQCDKPPKKKKKPKQERAVCRQGTYTQRKKGISYTPHKIVPCEGVERKTKSRPRRPRSPTIGDLARDVFNLP